MAKSIVLYGVFLGAIICFCSYVDRFGVIGSRPKVLEVGFDLENFVGPAGRGISSVLLPMYKYDALDQKRLAKFRSSSIENLQDINRLNASEEKSIRSKIKMIYSAEIGVREKTGKNDGERVEEYLAVTKLGKGYAWCAAFVSWVFAEAGFAQPRTPWSPSLFPRNRVIWDRGVKIAYASLEDKAPRTLDPKPKTQHLIPNPPATGDVFGIYFANLKRIAHVGFVDEWGEKYIITVEGNTNEAGGNEGDGVYKKRRLISSIYQVADWMQGQEGVTK